MKKKVLNNKTYLYNEKTKKFHDSKTLECLSISPDT